MAASADDATEPPTERRSGRGGPPPEAMPPTPPAWKLLSFGLGASAALVATLVMPPAPPERAGARYDPSRLPGGAAPSDPIRVDLGALSRWDALRGRRLWGAIVVADGQQPRVFATTTRPGQCESTAALLACPNLGGPESVAVIVSTGAADAGLDALVAAHATWADFEAALRLEAGGEPWSLHFPLARSGESR